MRKTRNPAPQEPEYRVGYGRPPLATRFQKGNTAAKGRHNRRAKSLLASLVEALLQPTVYTDADGRRCEMAKGELGLRRLADKVAAGDPLAMRLVLGLVPELERRPPPEPAPRASLAPRDKDVIGSLRDLLRRW